MTFLLLILRALRQGSSNFIRLIVRGCRVFGRCLYSGFVFLIRWCTCRDPSYVSGSSQGNLKVYPVVAAETFGAHNEILQKIKVEVSLDPTDCHVVMVFCPVLTRLLSDVDYAMTKIQEEVKHKDMILVMMHYTRDPSYVTVPNIISQCGYQKIMFEVQVLYCEPVDSEALLKCDVNDQAIQRLEEMCKNIVKSMQK